jgi:hypothetical protein
MRLICLKLNEHDGQETLGAFGCRRTVGPAICGLHVRDEARPAEYEVLWFHALRSVQPESRLLQGHGFFSISQRVAGRPCNAPCAGDGCNRCACFATGDAIRRSFSLGLRGAPAFTSRAVHSSFFPPDLIRFSAVRQRTGLSLVVSLLFL